MNSFREQTAIRRSIDDFLDNIALCARHTKQLSNVPRPHLCGLLASLIEKAIQLEQQRQQLCGQVEDALQEDPRLRLPCWVSDLSLCAAQFNNHEQRVWDS